jgi:hypothetical protein
MNHADKEEEKIENNIENKSEENNSKIINKPELKRRNAVANFELLDSYKDFIKIYNQIQKEK